MKRSSFLPLVALAASVSMAQAATVSWGPVGSNIQVGDLITTGSPVFAVNGGSDAAGAVTIGDNAFVVASITAAISGAVSDTGNGGYYSPSSGSADLDVVLDSHTYISGTNPNGRGQIDLPGLTIGNLYQVQMIGVGDDRSCCATRTQFVDDGNGNVSGALARGTGDWVVGSFVATASTESLFVTGETDPGLSGLVLRDLGAVPEPSMVLLSLLGFAGLIMRRRR